MLMLFSYACSTTSSRSERLRLDKIKNSPQYRAGKFQNTVRWQEPSFGEYFPVLKEFLFGDEQRVPDETLPRSPVDLSHFNATADNQLAVTWLGHSSLMINMDGYRILTDPVFEEKVTIVGPSRFNGNLPLDIDALENIDLVIISHNHYDHLNKFSIQFLNDRTRLFVVPLAVGAHLEAWGIPREKIVELDWWEEHRMDSGLMVAATPTQHFSGRGLTDRNKTLWASFVIQTVRHRVFFSGDSGYFDGFKKIGEAYGPFDMTFIECGAYNEKWHFIHMFPEETLQAHLDLKGKILHPIHWATFNLSLHAWYEPMERLHKAAEHSQVSLATPVVGGTTVFNNSVAQTKWWQPLAVSNQNVDILPALRGELE